MGLGEPFSFISHAVGAVLAVAGLVLLVVLADGALEVTAAAVYGATLVALYSISSTYHAFPQDSPSKPLLRRMDHVGIYLLIAGTYTPVVLVAMGGGWGWSLFGVVWGLAAAGIVIKITVPLAPRWITVAGYVGLGWLAVVATPVLIRIFSGPAIGWLLGGGVAYTVGAIVYIINKGRRVWGLDGHDIWHLFVMAGSGAHFVLVARYVL